MVAHVFSLAFIAVMTYFSAPGSSKSTRGPVAQTRWRGLSTLFACEGLFSWHPFLMTVGFVGFMFQAIVVYSRESSLFSNVGYKTKLNLHIFLQTMGLLCIINGFLAIYYNKEEHGKEHFTSWHGLIGIGTIGYVVIQYLAGFLLGFPKLKEMLGLKSLKYSVHAIYHATSGTLLYVLACLSIGLGIYSNWFTGNAPFYIWYLSFALTSFLGLIISMQVTSKYVTNRYNAGTNIKLDLATNKVKVEEAAKGKSKRARK